MRKYTLLLLMGFTTLLSGCSLFNTYEDSDILPYIEVFNTEVKYVYKRSYDAEAFASNTYEGQSFENNTTYQASYIKTPTINYTYKNDYVLDTVTLAYNALGFFDEIINEAEAFTFNNKQSLEPSDTFPFYGYYNFTQSDDNIKLDLYVEVTDNEYHAYRLSFNPTLEELNFTIKTDIYQSKTESHHYAEYSNDYILKITQSDSKYSYLIYDEENEDYFMFETMDTNSSFIQTYDKENDFYVAIVLLSEEIFTMKAYSNDKYNFDFKYDYSDMRYNKDEYHFRLSSIENIKEFIVLDITEEITIKTTADTQEQFYYDTLGENDDIYYLYYASNSFGPDWLNLERFNLQFTEVTYSSLSQCLDKFMYGDEIKQVLTKHNTSMTLEDNSITEHYNDYISLDTIKEKIAK